MKLAGAVADPSEDKKLNSYALPFFGRVRKPTFSSVFARFRRPDDGSLVDCIRERA